MTRFLVRALLASVAFWVFFGIEFGDWLGFWNFAYALPSGFGIAAILVRAERRARRYFAKAS
jgi:hypothetical protein